MGYLFVLWFVGFFASVCIIFPWLYMELSTKSARLDIPAAIVSFSAAVLLSFVWPFLLSVWVFLEVSKLVERHDR